MKKLITTAFCLIFLTYSANAQQWSGFGKITQMYIYPNYAVVLHTGSAISFYWSDLGSIEHQKRVMAILLTAKQNESDIRWLLPGSNGPEGYPGWAGYLSIQ